MRQDILADKHSRREEARFRIKSALFILRRGVQNTFLPTRRFIKTTIDDKQNIIAQSESELWNTDDNAYNWRLTAGKVQNLRVAVQLINGLEIPAGKVFSFWKHVGNPNIKKFVVGREIREGCIIPTKAGGLCQLSNALYDAALKAGFEIVERHKHTRVIKGSLAEQNRDATVKWNYVDLRFKSHCAFRISAGLSDTQLIVKFIGIKNSEEVSADIKTTWQTPAKLNDCYSCGNIACFKHPGQIIAADTNGVTAFILDECWPEFDSYVKSVASAADVFIVPALKSRWLNPLRQGWSALNIQNTKTATFAALRRELLFRLQIKRSKNIFASQLKTDRQFAESIKSSIPLHAKHIVVSQNLLPFLWEAGVLGGRTFDVLMSRLPIQVLHERLNAAFVTYPESKTLHDFRAGQRIIDLENIALTKARHVITPHAELAGIFNNKAISLKWAIPAPPQIQPTAGNGILFPASALARKGAYEMRKLAKELKLNLWVSGRATEAVGFWGDIHTARPGHNILDGIKLVVYPAYVEHRPVTLLKAIAAGIPVIATTACGLLPTKGVTVVPNGDYEAFRSAVRHALQHEQDVVAL